MHAANIVSLNLSKNPLLEIPKDFVQDTENLRDLRLSHMSMKKVPTSIRLITSLQRLDISCNRIVDLEDSGFEKLQLQLFKAHNNRMDKLPVFFARMQSLKFLTISNNKFDHLPPAVCELSHLVDLDISFNMLQDLPDEIAQLTQLERLIIVGNQITRFPPACSALRSLKELDCRRNMIADLAPIIRLSRLVTLRADHNTIHLLDFAFGPSLEILDVSYNDITKLSVHPDREERYALRSLDLSHAKLSSLDDFPFHRLPLLQVLKLDYNSFRSIPESLCKATELREFSCTNNALDALPMGIGHLQRLEQINVQHNNLSLIPSTLWNCASLKSLNATSNLVKVWGDYTPTDGDATDGQATDRKASLAGSLHVEPPLAMSLEQLYLGDNQLGDDVFTPLCRLRSLLILNLCFNQIQDIPRWFFSTVTQLQELYLSGNKLSNLPTEDLYRMTDLRALYLNGNRLHTLPAELGKCKALEILDVGSNLLKYNINNWEFDWNW
jgi:adenylate cyclase